MWLIDILSRALSALSLVERNYCAILVEGIMRNNSVKLYEFGQVVQKMLFKDISYLELWRLLCSADWNHLCSFGRSHYEENFCEIILV